MIKSKDLRFLFIVVFIFSITFTSVSVFAGGKYYYDDKWNNHTHADVSLYVDNTKIDFDVPPLIINDRTLVPVRLLFEKMGASVFWNERDRQVKITTDDYAVVLYIDNKKATVNGKTVYMDVPAKIITDTNNIARTFVPARFVSEQLGYKVLWDGQASRVTIQTVNQKEIEIKSVRNYTEGNKDVIEINFSSKPDAKILKLSNPERLVVDFSDTKLLMNDGATNTSGIGVSNVRYAYHSGEYSRVVVDLKSSLNYTTSFANNVYKIVITNPVATNQENSNLIALNENAKSKKVVIDPGHGGSDSGALGINDDGTIDLYEKDVNLDVALEVYRLLKSTGLNVYITRTTDAFVGLVERAEYANKLGADLFVSVHQNSFTSNEANGSLVLYYANEETQSSEKENTTEEEASTGKILAENILKQLVATLDTTNRGLVNGSRYIVINKTTMPSVIVESAFISNPDERDKMKTPEYKNLIALSIANGIIKTLNETL